jgi:hypothetical protein
MNTSASFSCPNVTRSLGRWKIKDARPHAHMRRPVEILHLRIVWLPNHAKSPPIPDPGITWPIPSARVPSRGVLPLDLNGIGSLSPIFSSLINSSFERLPCIEALSEILRWRGSRCLPQPGHFQFVGAPLQDGIPNGVDTLATPEEADCRARNRRKMLRAITRRPSRV